MAAIFQLSPPVNALASIQAGRDMRQQQQQTRSQNALRDLYRGSDLSTPAGRQATETKAMGIDPLQAQPFIDAIGRMDQRDRERASRLTDDVGRTMVQIHNAPPERQAALYAQAQQLYPEVLTEPFAPDVVEKHLMDAQSITDILSRQDRKEQAAAEARKPQSGLAKLHADLVAGNISPSDYASAVRKETYIAPTGGGDAGAWETVTLNGQTVQRNRRTGKVEGMPGGSSSDWQTGKGPGGVDFRYRTRTGETNLSRPSGGFYSLDEMRGAIPPGQPLVPRTQQPGGGPAFDWKQYGGSADTTAAQQANNDEIDAARKYLHGSGMSFDDIMSRSQQYDATGMPNPQFDPYIGSAYRTALQHRVGADPQFDAIQQQLRPKKQAGGGGGFAPAQTLSGSGTQNDPYTPSSEGDMDAVQPGEFYVNPSDGQLYQKQ